MFCEAAVKCCFPGLSFTPRIVLEPILLNGLPYFHLFVFYFQFLMASPYLVAPGEETLRYFLQLIRINFFFLQFHFPLVYVIKMRVFELVYYNL